MSSATTTLRQAAAPRLRPTRATPLRRRRAQSVAALLPEDLLKVILDTRGYDSAAPRKHENDPAGEGRNRPPQTGRGLGLGAKTFGAAQVLDRMGQQVAFAQAVYDGGASRHAEPQIVSQLLRRLANIDTRGFSLMVAVDQIPCSPAERNCAGLLRSFARQLGMALQVFVPELVETAAQTSGPKWTARTHNRRAVRPRLIIDVPLPTQGVGASRDRI